MGKKECLIAELLNDCAPVILPLQYLRQSDQRFSNTLDEFLMFFLEKMDLYHLRNVHNNARAPLGITESSQSDARLVFYRPCTRRTCNFGGLGSWAIWANENPRAVHQVVRSRNTKVIVYFTIKPLTLVSERNFISENAVGLSIDSVIGQQSMKEGLRRKSFIKRSSQAQDYVRWKVRSGLKRTRGYPYMSYPRG
ncbi:hypothetical protein NPIL_618131 [Nephila pilipes]|uniref:Uncharacterized protein n=1 Tax=Nephila pilipes TaxID=299642 RepID=A0A8X6MUJ3_NEPPI|nr:hypothetical protein NPIL_618131 [Nephila pilipes]